MTKRDTLLLALHGCIDSAPPAEQKALREAIADYAKTYHRSWADCTRGKTLVADLLDTMVNATNLEGIDFANG